MTKRLHEIKEGSEIKLEEIAESVRTNLIRLGLCVGDTVKCVAKVPNGPVVLSKGLQEVAIGNDFAKNILVREIKN